MADEPGIEHGVEVVPSVGALVGQAPQAHPVGGGPGIGPAVVVGVAHATIVARTLADPVGPAARPSSRNTRTHEGERRSPQTIGEHRSPRSDTP